MLRFQCRVDHTGGDVCTIGPKAYTFLAWYMKCDRSGECEDEVTLREINKPHKIDTASAFTI